MTCNPDVPLRPRSPQEETTPGSRRGIALPPPKYIFAVAAGGAVGAVLRHVFVLVVPHDRGAFPVVTFAENVIGAFLLGVVLIALLRAPRLGARWRPFLATGVLGSFTTFSNVSVQIVELVAEGAAATALAYTGLNVSIGVGAAALGVALGALLMNRLRTRG